MSDDRASEVALNVPNDSVSEDAKVDKSDEQEVVLEEEKDLPEQDDKNTEEPQEIDKARLAKFQVAHTQICIIFIGFNVIFLCRKFMLRS